MKEKDLVRSLAWCVLGLVLVGGCSKKNTAARPGVEVSETGDTSMHGEAAREYYVPEAEQRRWVYDAMPTPDPSHKPNYLLKSIGFSSLSAGVDGEATAVLRTLAEDMQARPNIQVIAIGFADAGGEKANGENLGMQRAQAIRQILVNSGVAKDRIEVASFGARMTTAPASDGPAMEKARVSEIWLMNE